MIRNVTSGTSRPAGLLTVMVLAAITCLGGCGGSEPAGPQAAEPAVNPRYASADALLAYYNELAMKGPKVDYRAILSLMHAENTVQESLLRIQRLSMPLAELEHLCWEEYGRCMDRSYKESPLAPNRQPAVMTEREELRAKAKELINDGTSRTIYLVSSGGRWWVSGYTYEYDPNLDLSGMSLDDWERVIGYMSSVAPTVAAEVRSGKWGENGSPEAVAMSLAAHVMSKYPEAGRDLRPPAGEPEG